MGAPNISAGGGGGGLPGSRLKGDAVIAAIILFTIAALGAACWHDGGQGGYDRGVKEVCNDIQWVSPVCEKKKSDYLGENREQ